MADVTVTKKTQELDEPLSDGLSLDPKHVVNYYIDNIVSRVIAYLMGWDDASGCPVKIAVTKAGYLKVSSTGTVFSRNDVRTGTAGDTYSAMINFDKIVSRVDIWIWDNPAMIRRSYDGLVTDDEFEIPANTMYSFDATTYCFKIKNKTAGAAARYQVVGWY